MQATVGGSYGRVVVNGVTIPGNKLRIMAPVKFAPSWVSPYTGTARGYIYENIDEYPTRTQPKTLEDLQNDFTKKYFKALEDKRRARVEKATEYQKSLTYFNAITAQGGTLGTIASAVSALREGYGMLLTAANFVADPFGTLASSLGISPQQLGGVFNAIGQAAQGNFKPLGQGLVSYVPGLNMFLGKASYKSWENWVDRVASQDAQSLFLQGETKSGSAKLGEVYNSNEYVSKGAVVAQGNQDVAEELGYDTSYGADDYISAGGGDRDYDSAYGDSDYEPLIESIEATDAETLAAEGDLPETGTFGEEISRTEPNADKVEQSIDEAYGNTDDAAYGDNRDDPSTIEDVYGGEGTISHTQPTAEERAALLAALYGSASSTQTEDTSGITTSDDDSAPIDPVV